MVLRTPESRDNPKSDKPENGMNSLWIALLALFTNNNSENGENILAEILRALTGEDQEEPLNSTFARAHNYTGERSFETTPSPLRISIVSTPLPPDTPAEDQVRHAMSDGIRATLQAYAGTPYLMGGKSSEGIDCSGFVAKAITTAINNIPDEVNLQNEGHARITVGFNGSAMQTSSEGQLQALIARGADVLDTQGIKNNLRGGMVLCMDTGEHGWDGGRKHGIDHVVITYEGTDGKIYVAQSSGGQGVNSELASDYIKRFEDKGTKFLGVDLVEMAKITQESRPEIQVAATSAPAPVVATGGAPAV